MVSFDEIKIMNILNEISEKLTYITEHLEYIENDLKDIKKSSNNMDDHISFVENVYDTVKYPFYYIINKIKPINLNDIPKKQIKNE
jgi:hypothetical protein